jgi:uncharacterized protein (TIGR00375 family)
MRFIADFHVHSKYSRATSKDMDAENLARWAAIKGINLMGTGDFTHPNYFAELRLRLKPAEEGLYRLKKGDSPTRFILTAETSHIYKQNGKSHRIHIILFAPDLETAGKINSKLARLGNIASDGRPILGTPVQDMVKLLLDISPKCFIVPAHAWTPWFSVFGSASGFDSIEECFGDQSKNIHCIETGLSSDPAMNWRLSALDKITLISNSDAHSPRKIGREANAFDCQLAYSEIIDTLKTKNGKKLLYTIEFFPEEGKYHYNGHRACNVIQSPGESKKTGNACPVCKKPLTIGVCHRVEALADRPAGFTPPNAIPNKYLIPLEEIIADALDMGTASNTVSEAYHKLIARGKNEFNILLDMPLDELNSFAPPRIAEAVKLVREKKLNIIPGYDGVFGKISIFKNPKYGENQADGDKKDGSWPGSPPSAVVKEDSGSGYQTPEPPPPTQIRMF